MKPTTLAKMHNTRIAMNTIYYIGRINPQRTAPTSVPGIHT